MSALENELENNLEILDLKTPPDAEQMKQELRGEIEREIRRKQRKKRWLWLLLLLLLLMAGYFLWRYMGDQKSDRIQKELNAEMGILPGMSDEEIQDRLNRQVAEGMLNMDINPTPQFADGTSEGNIRIQNIQGNKYSFSVSVTCIGASEDPGAQDYVDSVVMKTGMIDPGSFVEYKKLDENLPKGQYTCVATFHAYRRETDEETGTENYEPVGAGGVQILITVNN